MSPFELINSLAAAKVRVSIENGNLALSAPKGALTADLLEKIKNSKAELLDILQHDSTGVQRIPPADRSLPLALSFGQQRLWFIDQLDSSTAYNLSESLRLTGPLNYHALNSAFTTILMRHQSLRTCFIQGESGSPIQVIQDVQSFAVPLADCSDLAEDLRWQAVKDIQANEASTRFDLRSDLMLRARLLKLSDLDHVLLVTMHHIAFDGWSTSILLNEFAEIYQAECEGRQHSLALLPIQYADYAQWQRKWLSGEVIEKQLTYWEKQLCDLPATHGLPLDRPRPVRQTFTGSTYSSSITLAATDSLHRLCKQQGATLFMGLQAAFSVLLARFSGERDIVMGTPVANREQAEVGSLIGFFANTLVLRSNLAEEPSFSSVLTSSRQMLLEAYANQQLPFEQIVERLQPERSLSYSPLFQIFIQMQNNERGKVTLPNLNVQDIELGVNAAKFDLTLDITEAEGGLALKWEYNTDLFNRTTIKRLACHFETLIAVLTNFPDQNVFDLNFVTEDEKQLQLESWNSTAAHFPEEFCIHQLFEMQVQASPHAIALEYQDQQLTYAELNDRANRLAHYLITEKSVKPDTFVGICLERSVDMVVAMLGIYKAGAAYVPLDPDYPPSRIQYMLDDANLAIVLTHKNLSANNILEDGQALCMDDQGLLDKLASQSAANPKTCVTPCHLAYMIYTSGSTGNPKGVMIEHRALVNRIDWMNKTYGCGDDDRILQKTPFSFDVSVWEFVWPLTAGARLVLAKPGGHQDASYLTALIADKQITKLHFVPSMLSSMLSAGALDQCHSLKQVFCSGEALAVQQVAKFQQACEWAELHNLYGPTETAIDVSFWDCAGYDGSQSNIPIGQPISNITLHVLDKFNRPVPIGVAGELHIGGVGLARGYCNRPELTAEKFIKVKLAGSSTAQRLYKTGDLVRWRDNGVLDYLGRQDFQVKLRGFRIELGEIEAVIGRHPNVSETLVSVYDDGHGKRLVAYLVTEADDLTKADAGDELREFLLKSLPSHMVPAHFVVLDQMPRTPNGKVNRKALPAPDIRVAGETYAAPETPVQHAICSIWQSLLKLEKIGIDDNVFNLGADSLVVIQAVARLKAAEIQTDVKAIFEYPTVRTLAASINGQDGDSGPLGIEKAGPGLAPLTLAQKWLFTQNSYDHPKWRNMSVFDCAFEIDLDLLKQAFTQVLNRHDSLRSTFSAGDQEWVCNYSDYLDTVDIQVTDIDFNDAHSAELIDFMKRLDACLDLRNGPIIKLGYARVRGDLPDKLCLVVHHLVVDQYSYSVLFDDLFKAYVALAGGQPVQLPSSTPLRAVTEWTSDKNVQKDIYEQVHHWLRDTVAESTHILPRDFTGLPNTLASQTEHRQIVSADNTQKILDACKASVGDLSLYEALLTALTNVICRWSGESCLQVTAVSALRSDIARASGFDLTRTIGWIAGAKVLAIRPANHAMYCDRLRNVKEQLEAIPYGGFYIADFNAYVDHQGKHLITDEVKFNYQGVVDSGSVSDDSSVLSSRDDLVGKYYGDASDPDLSGDRSGTFMIYASIRNDQLEIRWEYSRNLHAEQTIRELTDKVVNELLKL